MLSKETRDYMFDFFKDESIVAENPSTCLIFLKHLRKHCDEVIASEPSVCSRCGGGGYKSQYETTAGPGMLRAGQAIMDSPIEDPCPDRCPECGGTGHKKSPHAGL